MKAGEVLNRFKSISPETEVWIEAYCGQCDSYIEHRVDSIFFDSDTNSIKISWTHSHA